MPRKKTTKRKRSTKTKPIGFVKEGKSFKLVFGTKAKPRLGSKKYGSKAALVKKAKQMLKK